MFEQKRVCGGVRPPQKDNEWSRLTSEKDFTIVASIFFFKLTDLSLKKTIYLFSIQVW